jgi:hypothetical protein
VSQVIDCQLAFAVPGTGATQTIVSFHLPPFAAGHGFRATANFQFSTITGGASAAAFFLNGLSFRFINASGNPGLRECRDQLTVVNINGSQTTQVVLLDSVLGSIFSATAPENIGPPTLVDGPKLEQGAFNLAVSNLLEFRTNTPAGASGSVFWVIETI